MAAARPQEELRNVPGHSACVPATAACSSQDEAAKHGHCRQARGPRGSAGNVNECCAENAGGAGHAFRVAVLDAVGASCARRAPAGDSDGQGETSQALVVPSET
jgi:hypothetical protein